MMLNGRTRRITAAATPRGWLVLLLLTGEVATGCKRSPARVESSSVSDASATAPSPPAGRLDWIATARRLYADNYDKRAERPQDAVAQVRFSKSSLPELWRQRYCAADCTAPNIFVRVRIEAGVVSIYPHCNSQQPELALVEEWLARGPWKLVEGEFRTNAAFVLRSGAGEKIAGNVEQWTPPWTAAKDVWDDWLYSRSLAVAHAQSEGIQADLLGRTKCRDPRNLALCEAELATEGSPLALLRSLGPCPLNYMSDQECKQLRVGLPVQTGHFNNFCGRVDIDPLKDPPSREDREVMIRRRVQLEAAGVDVARLLLGTAWTAHGQYVPQVSMDQLALAIRAVGLDELLAKRAGQLRDSGALAWPNRFRAAVLSAMLTGARPAGPTLRKMFQQYANPCPEGATDCSTRDAEHGQGTDACIDLLLGRGSFGCMFG